MKIKKSVVLLIIPVLILAGISVNLSSIQSLLSSSNDINEGKTIILDAGHGGFDGGAVANDGTVEKDINLQIALTVADFLRTSGYNVILTRQADVSTDDVESDKIAIRKKSDLKNRLELMNDYPDAVFVSVHLNKFTTSAASGAQVFYSPKKEDSRTLGELIQKSITQKMQPDNSRVIKRSGSSTYILHNATIPAVLVECGFLSNKAELENLKNEDYQKKMAFCIFCGITEFFENVKEI